MVYPNTFITDTTLPVIQSKIYPLLNVIYDVTAVGLDTWLFCPDGGYAIEFFHKYEIYLVFS